jgi:hypothetical protein
MLDARTIDDREHFFWDGFGRRKETGAVTGDCNDGFCDGHVVFSRAARVPRVVSRE